MLVSLAFKLFVLAVGTWAVFFRRPRATLPRVQIYRALVCTLIVVFLTSFWLFYVRHLVRIHDFGLNVGHKVEYRELVQFALNLVDSLLFVHYLAVLLMELRHKQSEYYIKVRFIDDRYVNDELIFVIITNKIRCSIVLYYVSLLRSSSS